MTRAWARQLLLPELLTRPVARDNGLMSTLLASMASLLVVRVSTALDPTPDPSEVEPGMWNTVVVLSIIGATVLLCISMARRVKRLNPSMRSTKDHAD